MRLIASWTRMHGEKHWVHHWIVRATCAQEAEEHVEVSLGAPQRSHAGPVSVFHRGIDVVGWKRRGYEVLQAGGVRG